MPPQAPFLTGDSEVEERRIGRSSVPTAWMRPMTTRRGNWLLPLAAEKRISVPGSMRSVAWGATVRAPLMATTPRRLRSSVIVAFS